MDIKELTAWVTISGIVGGALIWLYKKLVKPIVTAVKQYFDIVENSSKIEYNTLRVNALMQLSATPFFEADTTGGIVSANGSFIEIFGAYNENEIVGFGFLNFIVKEERAQVRNEWLDSVLHDDETIKVFTIENKKTREKVFCNFIAIMNKDDKGKLINILGKVSVIK